MRSPILSSVSFFVPDDVSAVDLPDDVGMWEEAAGGQRVLRCEVDLRTDSLRELRARVLAAIPVECSAPLHVAPTPDRRTPLHEERVALFGGRARPLSIGVYLVGFGWAHLVLAAEGQAVTLSCSHLFEPLRRLVDFGRATLDSGEARCSIANTPGWFRWRYFDGTLRVHWLEEEDVNRSSVVGTLAFEARCSGLTLARAILRSICDIEQRLSAENFSMLWREPYPAEPLDALRGLVRDAAAGRSRR